MTTELGAKVRGLPDLALALRGIPEKLRKRVLRNALAAGARVVRDEARRAAAPDLREPRRAPHRAPGTMRKAIVVRTSKRDRRAGDVGVFVNVRPAKPGQRGAKSRTDPFYWRWVNFGWNAAGRRTNGRGAQGKRYRRFLSGHVGMKMIPGRHFLEAGARRLDEALRVFIANVGPQIRKLNGGKDVQL